MHNILFGGPMRFITSLLFILLSLNIHANDDCIEIRAAFDIGSGATRMKVAEVDICKQKIVKVLLEMEQPVEYKQNLSESKDNTISAEMMIIGNMVLNQMKKSALPFNPVSYTAVATSAFRTADNGKEFIKLLAQYTGINITVISQQSEAKIGFVGASNLSDAELTDTVVWDIGGGSMQITSYEGNGKFIIYEGKLAAVSFKNHIIEEIQNNDPKNIKTPNPMSKDVSREATRDAKIIAKSTVPTEIIKKLKSPKTKVIGIGGVHYYSIGKKVSETNSYSLEMVDSELTKSIGLTDEQIGGKYASTDISNLALVAGFMKALNIELVQTGKVNLTDGVLINPNLAKN
jgi:exopolyphosphatase/guanosine-5'-triphosphate,3'-diphosphate pyrophosphatase